MYTVIYDGSFNGFLSAVFDIYEYKFSEVEISTKENFKGNVFGTIHHTSNDPMHSNRVWKGLQKILSIDAQQQIYRSFLSELPGIETIIFRYMRYAFASGHYGMENDFSNADVLSVKNVSKKVWREKHRMEAFVRFQKTGDGLFYSIIEPDHNVLPLIATHFEKRYADQQWMIYDQLRKYGIYYNLKKTTEVTIDFSEQNNDGKNITSGYDEEEEMYQLLWQQYFKSVNIPARKNKKLHLQHVPVRYWKYLTEKAPS